MLAAEQARFQGFLLRKFHLVWFMGMDIDSSMIQFASKNLNGIANVRLIKSDLLTVNLPTKVDVIFLNASIHWILDHRKLFENFWQMLNNEGEVLIQCGGHDNLEKIISVVDMIRLHAELRPFFCKLGGTLVFSKT